MEVNIVQKSDFRMDVPLSRCDAEFVWKSLWDVEKNLRERDGWTLGKLVRDYDGVTLSDRYRPEDDPIRYIDIDSIDTTDGLTYAEDILYGDRPSRAKYVTEENDLLVSNVRPNRGATTLVNSFLAGAMASSGFSLLRDKELKETPQAYLLAFLKSSFGRVQLKRRCRGSMYPAVTTNDLRNIWIPKPPDRVLNQVTHLIHRGVTLQVRFFELIREQQRDLHQYLSPLGSPPSPLEGNLKAANWTEIDRHATESSGRIDAEFFRHEYTDFDTKLRESTPSFLLGEYFTLTPGRGLGNGDDLVPFVKQGMLTNAGINWSALSYEPGALRSGGNVRQGDILLACTAHEVYYVGRKVDYVRDVPKEVQANNSAVTDLMVIRPRPEKPPEIHSSFVAAFLRDAAGLHQVQRCIRGLRGGHVYKEDLAKYVRVPVPEESWLQGFETRSADYESVRNQAKQDISHACQTVEDWLSEA